MGRKERRGGVEAEDGCFLQGEGGIQEFCLSRGLEEVYKGQGQRSETVC